MTMPHIPLPEMPDSLPGQMLDDYLLDKLLGQGGMARVYRAWDTKVRRYVAIKVIEKTFRHEADYIERFEREAQAIGGLQHPNIVTLYHYGEAEGVLYMAMQYIEGADLATLLSKYRHANQFIPPEEASHIVREVCAALDYAHSRGVIHRDVKPNNILLDQNGRATLTDFGLALLTEVGTRGEIFGSPHYISPEQAISSSGAVPQSDLYSLGVTLYEMFTGQVPFDAVNPLDISMMHMTELPPPPRQLRPDITPELEAVILKTLEKDPKDRYPSGEVLAEALDNALKSESPAAIQDTRQSILQAVTLEMQRHPLPLPPTPAGMPVPNLPAPQTQPGPPQPQTVPASPALETILHRQSPPVWLWGALAGGIVLCLIVIGGLVLLLTNNGDDSDEENTISQQQSTETPSPIAPTELSAPQAPAVTATLFPFSVTASPLVIPSTTPFPPLTDLPIATATAAPTLTPPQVVSGVEATPVVVGNYNVAFLRGDKDSLIILNTSATLINPALLNIQNRRGELHSIFQGAPPLLNTQCIVVVKGANDARDLKNLPCTPLIEPLVAEGEAFWREPFGVYYEGAFAGFCEVESCQLTFAPQSPTEATQGGYAIVISHDKDNLTIYNLTVADFPLAPLAIANQRGYLTGADWPTIGILANGQCVAAHTKNELKLPSGLCNEQNEVVSAINPSTENFWDRPFAVSYANRLVGFCDEEACTLDFAIPLSTPLGADRTIVPAGSTLLTGGIGLSNGAALPPGDMQIEGYCTSLGYGADHDDNDWFCEDAAGAPVLILSPIDFDSICQATYQRSTAFAIRQGNSSTPAFNWKCYGY